MVRFTNSNVLSLSAVFKFDCFEVCCMKESCWCVLLRIATKRKHNEVPLKTKYKELKELDKNRPNKEVAVQFKVPRSTLSTCNQPISTIFC